MTAAPIVIHRRSGTDDYVFIFHRSQREDLQKAAGRLAMNPALNFSWLDAAVVLGKARLQELM